MKLTAAHIKHFKSVRDSGKFKIDEKVTCLVGKNESGKTAVLQAIAKLNPIAPDDGAFDFDLEYPRDAWDEDRRGLEESAIDTTWTLEAADHEALAEVLGPGAVDIAQPITIAKGYYAGRRWNINIDEA